jgi:hypothetical protein
MRLFRRRRDAMDIWRAELPDTFRWTVEPEFHHAPDLDPSEVGIPERMGMDGRPLPKSKGAITGLEGGGSGAPYHHGA